MYLPMVHKSDFDFKLEINNTDYNIKNNDEKCFMDNRHCVRV